MKKLVALTAFLLLSSSWVMAQTDESSAEPPSGMDELQAYSIFYENYRAESYDRAVKFGRWIWKGMPEKLEGYSQFDLKRNLDRLVTSYSSLAEETGDPSVKEAYVDTALIIFENAFEKYGDDEDFNYDWRIKQGRFYQTHSSIIDDARTKAAESYREAYKIKPEEFTQRGDGYYMRVMLEEMIDEGEKDEALAVINKTEEYIPSDLESYYDEARNELFDSPEERITFLEGELEEDPENEDILTQLRDLYQEEDMSEKVSEVSKKLYELNSNFENTMALAEAAQSNADYDQAIKYLKESIEKAEEDEQKAEIALEISDAYLNQEDVQNAREYAQEAIEYDNDWGDPYIQIADIYAETISQCSSDRKLTPKDRAVYWLVLDYLDKAKSVDQSVANEVERKYESYEPVIPSKSDKFFWKPPLKDGNEFEIDADLNECYGWIDETTTVR